MLLCLVGVWGLGVAARCKSPVAVSLEGVRMLEAHLVPPQKAGQTAVEIIHDIAQPCTAWAKVMPKCGKNAPNFDDERPGT